MAASSLPPALPPEKLYFTIGEVAKIAGIKTHVLRFWETEFPQLSPRKDEAGRRIYRKPDLELVLKIRTLLYERKFTIDGARKTLAPGKSGEPEENLVEAVRRDLEAALMILRA